VQQELYIPEAGTEYDQFRDLIFPYAPQVDHRYAGILQLRISAHI
jgi:hypothetical protein